MGDSTNGGGCYTNAIRHSHSGSCYKSVFVDTCGCTAYINYNAGICDCGHGYGSHNNGMDCKAGYTNNVLECTKSTTAILGYDLGCGKTTETIESATIIY